MDRIIKDNLKFNLISTIEGDLPKLQFHGKTWYWAPEITAVECENAIHEEWILEHTVQFERTWWIPSQNLYEKKTALGRTYNYPDLFEKFWKEYHPQRRIGKKIAFQYWTDLAVEDREVLVSATTKYIAHMVATSQPKYILHPERFIKRKMYLDFLEFESNDEDILKVIEFFSLHYTKKVGNKFPFSEKDREKLITDVEAFGYKRLCELIWMYFNDYVSGAKVKARENMYDYYTFSYLLKGALNTKKPLPPKCQFCGKRLGHSNKCPQLHARKEEKRKENQEVETARNMDVDITGMFKEKIGK